MARAPDSTPADKRLRRLRMGLQTLLGPRAQGFFIPYRYADGIRERDMRAPYGALEPAFRAREAAFQAVLDDIASHSEALARIAEGGEAPPAPRFDQDWFPRLDAAAAYAMVARARPRRIVEVGSGHSTRFMARAIADRGLDCALTAIDPAPRATIEALPIRFIRAALQEAPHGAFEALGPGDILFIDSSHILTPGSDVDILFNRILPALPRGVLIHIHDIFLPDAYPPEWDWRGYNEQNSLGPALGPRGFEIAFASRYVATRMAERADAALVGIALKPGAVETSLWLRKA